MCSTRARFVDGRLLLQDPVDWPEGTEVVVTPVPRRPLSSELDGHVIIAGFGLSGRGVAELLTKSGIQYTIVEKNAVTVETQTALGRQIIQGDVTDPGTLVEAGLRDAGILALTIPDEEAVLRATSLARRLRPEIYIIARTHYTSKGLQATKLGADDVVKAEEAVALQFYEKLSQRIAGRTTTA